MKRALLDDLPAPGQQQVLIPEESHHLAKVRRCKLGETIELLDGRGGLAQAVIVTQAKGRLTVEVTSHPVVDRESDLQLGLICAIPVQTSTFDQMLPSLVQLGVSQIALVETEYSGRFNRKKTKYESRLQHIMRQALKQCGRLVVPELTIGADYDDALNRIGQRYETKIVFHPAPPSPSVPENPGTGLVMLIGAEGGLSDTEVIRAREAGFISQQLGPRILRMETAAVGACFWAQRRYGDLH